MPSLIWKLRINKLKMKSNMNVCPVCKKTFPTPANLKIHLRVHTLEKPFKCAKCDKAFNQQCNLQRHELLHSDLKPHSCEKCGKSFRSKSHLKLHSFTHTGVSRYKCNICDRKFGQSSTLKYHVLTHTGEKPHMCDICGKSFTQQSSLAIHKAIHSKVEFKCKECGKSFKHKTNLQEHQRSQHYGEVFPCDVCGKEFNYKSNLRKHMLRHKNTTGTFQCNDCCKRFAQKVGLQTHIKNVHLQANVVECAICDSKFNNKYTLERHLLRFHTSTHDKKYTCSKCYRRFKVYNSLKRHKNLYCPKKEVEIKQKKEEPNYISDVPSCETVIMEDIENIEIVKPEEYTEISYECDVCHVILDSPESLDVHLISHTQEEINTAESMKKILTPPKSKDAKKVKLSTPTKKITKTNTSSRSPKKNNSTSDSSPKTPPRKNKLATTDHCAPPRTLRKREKLIPSKYSTIIDTVEVQEKQEKLKKTEQQQKETSKHKCNTCSKFFNTSENLNRHVLTHEKKEIEITSQTKAELKPETPPRKPYECKICKAQFENVDKLKVHFFTHKKEEMFLLFCEMNETPQIVNGNNKMVSDENPPQKEKKIEKKTPSGGVKKEKTVTVKTSHGSIVSKTNPSGKVDKKSTAEIKKFTCSMCESKFTTIFSRLRHEKSYCAKRPRETNLTCILCKQECPKSDFEKHQSTCHKTASGETDNDDVKLVKFKKHVCECGRKFPTEFSLRKHRKRFCSLNVNKNEQPVQQPEQESPLDLSVKAPTASDVCKDPPPTVEDSKNLPQTPVVGNNEKPRKNSRKNYKVNRIVRET